MAPFETFNPFAPLAAMSTASAPSAPAAVAAASGQVCSPAGIRLVSGLLAPYLSPAGQAELAERWGVDCATLFAEALATARAWRTHTALHAALGVWVRNHVLPAPAAAALQELLQALPSDDVQAKALLDAWAAEHTNRMIEAFPADVLADTTAVFASAVAMEDTWACRTSNTPVPCTASPGWRDGFEAEVDAPRVLATVDEATVRVVLPLESGLRMAFAISTHGVDEAARLLETPEAFTVTPQPGQPYTSVVKVERPTDLVSVRLPEFTTRTRLDIGADPTPWGLAAAFDEGAPGLGDLPVEGMVQAAFIEVTHTGVRAAAVTALMFGAANAMMPRLDYAQTVVTFDGPFAYQIAAPGFATPLFTGTYGG